MSAHGISPAWQAIQQKFEFGEPWDFEDIIGFMQLFLNCDESELDMEGLVTLSIISCDETQLSFNEGEVTITLGCDDSTINIQDTLNMSVLLGLASVS